MSWRRYFRRRHRDEDLASEIESYVAHEIDNHVARGMSTNEARFAASRKFGNSTSVREAVYQMNSVNWVESIWRDIRYGARQLRSNPGFTLSAVLSLALGIGANTAIFQLLDAVRLRTLPVMNPRELAEVKILAKGGFGMNPGWISEITYPLWEQIRDHQQPFSGIFAWSVQDHQLGEESQSRRVRALWVSGNAFPTLGVVPVRGRLFGPDDDRRGCGARDVVLSHGMWQREFGGQNSAIGAKLMIDERLFTVTGVTPPEFFGLEVGKRFDVSMVHCTRAAWGNILDNRNVFWLAVVGRLKPGWTRERAAGHLSVISPGLFEAVIPPGYDTATIERFRKFRLTTAPAASGFSRLRNEYERSLWLLLGITGLVLLIACANVANLLLARSAARQREIAVRLAIGASRSRLVSQLLSESLLLAITCAAIGVALAPMFSRSLVWFLSTESDTFELGLNLDWSVLAFTAVVSILTCIVFGLAPALRSTQMDAASAMKSGARGSTADRTRFSFQRVLIVSQIGISLVLLVGALLFVRSFQNLTTLDAGFRQDGIIFAFTDFRRLRLPEERIQPFQRELLEKVRSIPGIESVSTSTHLPLGGSSWTLAVRLPGESKARASSKFTWISPGYFRTMEIPVLAGRDFNQQDLRTSRKVLVVNQTFARRFFEGADPVGKVVSSVAEPGYPDTVYEIAGVVKDTKYGDLRQGIPSIAFAAETQSPQPGPFVAIVTRSAMPPASVIAAMKQRLTEVSPQIRVWPVVLRAMVEERLVRERVLAWLSGFFGALAAVLAMIGLYGVISYMVARRRSEIGIRLALGASRPGVIWLILRQVTVLLAIGIAVGAALSLAAARGAETLLFGLKPHDPLTLAMSAASLTAVAFLASLILAWRASRLDPMTSLREE